MSVYAKYRVVIVVVDETILKIIMEKKKKGKKNAKRLSITLRRVVGRNKSSPKRAPLPFFQILRRSDFLRTLATGRLGQVDEKKNNI